MKTSKTIYKQHHQVPVGCCFDGHETYLLCVTQVFTPYFFSCVAYHIITLFLLSDEVWYSSEYVVVLRTVRAVL